jgi:phosphotransferase system  glucose/maltose/N-acetylglucosamine-specific IIC component
MILNNLQWYLVIFIGIVIFTVILFGLYFLYERSKSKVGDKRK